MRTLTPRPYWSSMTSYLLVTTGAVVGLGNFIFFPYLTYKFGGLFFLLYILCELLVSLPLLLGELLLGRRGKQNPVGSFSILSMESGASRSWRWIGWLFFIILFLTLANYVVLVSFPALYFTDSLRSISIKTSFSSWITLETCLLVSLFGTMLVILRGINRGLETISRIVVPLYFIILLSLAIYSCSIGNVELAIHHLVSFETDASFIATLFVALTYAFLKLNVGMGSMIVYGSYLPYSVPIVRSTIIVICFDAIISLLAYFVIFPLFIPEHSYITSIRSYQETLFYFLQAHDNNVVSILFFFALFIAAWMPCIAMAESATITLIERFDLSRSKATLIIFAGAALLGSAIIYSYYGWADNLIFNQWSLAKFVDGLTTNILMPLSALLTAIFVGWIVQRHITESELGLNSAWYSLWLFLIKLMAPILILVTMMVWLFT